jgi:hypothetical protein
MTFFAQSAIVMTGHSVPVSRCKIGDNMNSLRQILNELGLGV